MNELECNRMQPEGPPFSRQCQWTDSLVEALRKEGVRAGRSLIKATLRSQPQGERARERGEEEVDWKLFTED
jgi:hypothetical protein